MKKPYKTVDYVSVSGGYALRLDEKPALTPATHPFQLPTKNLAHAVAGEWQSQKSAPKLETMPLTQLAFVAIDLAGERRAAVMEDILPYAGTDLVCYRAGDVPELESRQKAALDPLLDWMQERFGVTLHVTGGLMPVAQPETNRGTLEAALARYDQWHLGALAVTTRLLGSLVLALAFIERHIDAEAALRLSQLEEAYETESWGEDEEKEARLKKLREELVAAERFLGLL